MAVIDNKSTLSQNRHVQQIELNFVPATELRKDTLRAIATVAHGGGGVIQKDFYTPRRGRPAIHTVKQLPPRYRKHDAEIQKRLSIQLGIKPLAIQRHQRKNNAPKPFNCFALWYRARKKHMKETGNTQRRYASKKDRLRAARRRNYLKHRDKINERNSAWRKSDLGKKIRNAFVRRWRKQKYASDPQFKLAASTRARIRKVLRRSKIKKCFRTNELIGCSAEQLKLWLESQLLPGMTWANYGTYWHVDHKRPLASFDLTDRAQLFAACHYTNLQPLTAFDNMSKGAKLIYVKKAA